MLVVKVKRMHHDSWMTPEAFQDTVRRFCQQELVPNQDERVRRIFAGAIEITKELIARDLEALLA
jgi:hypothetical protein